VLDSWYGDPQLAVKYRVLFVLGSDGGVFSNSRVLALVIGAGNGGIIGDDPPSAVEDVEKAGELGRSGVAESSAVLPSCATAPGVGEETCFGES
jgi:hypothetical protein